MRPNPGKMGVGGGVVKVPRDTESLTPLSGLHVGEQTFSYYLNRLVSEFEILESGMI